MLYHICVPRNAIIEIDGDNEVVLRQIVPNMAHAQDWQLDRAAMEAAKSYLDMGQTVMITWRDNKGDSPTPEPDL